MTDDRDRGDAVLIAWTPEGRASRRQVFEPRSDDGPDWMRIEEVRNDAGEWRPVGQELVGSVTVEPEMPPTLTYLPTGRAHRRERFTRNGDGLVRHEQALARAEWRTIGTERVTEVVVESP